MIYSPKPKRALAATLAFFGIVTAFSCGVLGAFFGKQMLFFCISCTFILFSFQLLFRFCFTGYTYEIDDGVLYVLTWIGKKQNTVFTLDLALVTSVCRGDEVKRLKSIYGDMYHKFNCCQNLIPKERCAVIYDNGKRMAVILECDEEFAKKLTSL